MVSVFTGNVIQNHFFKGDLPLNDMVCPNNEILFPPVKNMTNAMTWMAADVHNVDD